MDGMSPSSRSEEGIHISLTDRELDILSTMDLVRSPKAGAMVLFAGTSMNRPQHEFQTPDGLRRHHPR
jgi:hypothetical protein